MFNVKPVRILNEFLEEQLKHTKEKRAPGRSVSNDKFSRVTLNALTAKAREAIL